MLGMRLGDLGNSSTAHPLPFHYPSTLHWVAPGNAVLKLLCDRNITVPILPTLIALFAFSPSQPSLPSVPLEPSPISLPSPPSNPPHPYFNSDSHHTSPHNLHILTKHYTNILNYPLSHPSIHSPSSRLPRSPRSPLPPPSSLIPLPSSPLSSSPTPHYPLTISSKLSAAN